MSLKKIPKAKLDILMNYSRNHGPIKFFSTELMRKEWWQWWWQKECSPLDAEVPGLIPGVDLKFIFSLHTYPTSATCVFSFGGTSSDVGLFFSVFLPLQLA